MSKNLPTLSPCEAHQLKVIHDAFGPLLTLLNVEQLAQLLATSSNNVAQLLRRGHIPVHAVRLGARVFFPVPLIAAWLCGAQEAAPLCVPLPQKTPLRVRSASDLRARLSALRVDVEKRAQTLRDADDLKKYNDARERHAHASAQLVALVEREALRARAGLGRAAQDSTL